MQSYEFEAVMRYMTTKADEFDIAGQFDRLDLADVLLNHEITTIDRLPDVVSLARNLQAGVDSKPEANSQ